MIPNTNLIHYYTTLQLTTIPLYMTDTTTYMLWQLIESPIYTLRHRYSNLAYSYTSIDSASFPMILWHSGWNLLHIIPQSIQQPWYSCYNNQLYHSRLWHQYSKLAYYLKTIDSASSYNLMIPLIQLTHHYPTSGTATLMKWYSYTTINNTYTWLDTTTLFITPDTTTNIRIQCYLIQQSLYYDTRYSNLSY